MLPGRRRALKPAAARADTTGGRPAAAPGGSRHCLASTPAARNPLVTLVVHLLIVASLVVLVLVVRHALEWLLARTGTVGERGARGPGATAGGCDGRPQDEEERVRRAG
jgi:hypothetical protein